MMDPIVIQPFDGVCDAIKPEHSHVTPEPRLRSTFSELSALLDLEQSDIPCPLAVVPITCRNPSREIVGCWNDSTSPSKYMIPSATGSPLVNSSLDTWTSKETGAFIKNTKRPSSSEQKCTNNQPQRYYFNITDFKTMKT